MYFLSTVSESDMPGPLAATASTTPVPLVVTYTYAGLRPCVGDWSAVSLMTE